MNIFQSKLLRTFLPIWLLDSKIYKIYISFPSPLLSILKNTLLQPNAIKSESSEITKSIIFCLYKYANWASASNGLNIHFKLYLVIDILINSYAKLSVMSIHSTNFLPHYSILPIIYI